jgi:hypothetical protein
VTDHFVPFRWVTFHFPFRPLPFRRVAFRAVTFHFGSLRCALRHFG